MKLKIKFIRCLFNYIPSRQMSQGCGFDGFDGVLVLACDKFIKAMAVDFKVNVGKEDKTD